MKANELMIGDWFEWHPDAIPTQHHYERVSPKTFQLSKKHLEKANPISLTPKILEKNGFLPNGEFPFYDTAKVCHNDRGEWFITFFECWAFDINYVHELQHALRICGLNELAENFQVI